MATRRRRATPLQRIQFLKAAKANLNTQHTTARAAKAAAGRVTIQNGKYVSGPHAGESARLPAPGTGKFQSGPRAGQPTLTAVRQNARMRVNAQLAKAREELKGSRAAAGQARSAAVASARAERQQVRQGQQDRKARRHPAGTAFPKGRGLAPGTALQANRVGGRGLPKSPAGVPHQRPLDYGHPLRGPHPGPPPPGTRHGFAGVPVKRRHRRRRVITSIPNVRQRRHTIKSSNHPPYQGPRY